MQAGRAGGARIWAPVVVGEQVMVHCPGGDTAQGVIGGSVASDAFPPPSSDGQAYRVELPGGVILEVAGGAVRITAPAGLVVTGDVKVTGDVQAAGISLRTHVHGGVTRRGRRRHDRKTRGVKRRPSATVQVACLAQGMRLASEWAVAPHATRPARSCRSYRHRYAAL
ncbi:phage baseplate assembly protein V [Acidimangrovimonas sediminis]|uniref:phage baseplate assembly protein V n=1 Tax=Acidimangrovimonas sediminis TaxID=2056283 RepID=UPI000C7FE3C4|nr:phage baseplate assembly protein V [Acidimangrovimonas sediminis]